MPSIFRRKRFWATLLAVALLVWSLYDLDVTRVGHIIRGLRYPWLLWAMLVVAAMVWVRSARWRVLVNPMKVISGSRMFAIYSVGQLANLLFPAGTGTALRVVLLHRQEGVTKTGAASTVMLETLLDGLSLLLFMVGASAALVLPEWLQRGRTWGAVVITGIMGLLLLMVQLRDKVGSYVARLEGKMSPRVHKRVAALWNNFTDGLAALRSLKHLTLAFFCSIASWLGNLAVISLLFYAFGFVLPPGAALVLMIVNTLLFVIPITPGNVGTYQVACVIGLGVFGVPKTDAVSYGLVLQFTTFLPIAAVGLSQYFRTNWSKKVVEELKSEIRTAAD